MAQAPNKNYTPRARRNSYSWGAGVLMATSLLHRTFKVEAKPSADDEGSLVVGLGVEPSVKWMVLTSLTVEELDAWYTTMTTAYELSRPICEEMDQRATAEFEAGDDTNSRLYRRLPFVAFLDGRIEAHAARLPSGFDTTAFVARTRERISRWPGLGHLGGT